MFFSTHVISKLWKYSRKYFTMLIQYRLKEMNAFEAMSMRSIIKVVCFESMLIKNFYKANPMFNGFKSSLVHSIVSVLMWLRFVYLIIWISISWVLKIRLFHLSVKIFKYIYTFELRKSPAWKIWSELYISYLKLSFYVLETNV